MQHDKASRIVRTNGNSLVCYMVVRSYSAGMLVLNDYDAVMPQPGVKNMAYIICINLQCWAYFINWA